MKKILISVAAIAVIAVAAFGITRAYFSDTETSTGNTFAAGSLDLELKAGGNPVSVVFEHTNMYPGQVTPDKTLDFKNVGSLSGKVKVNITIDDEADADPEAGEFAGQEVSDIDYAKHMFVTTAITDGTDVTPYWVAQIVADGSFANVDAAKAAGAVATVGTTDVPTLYGMSLITVYFDPGTGDVEWLKDDEHHTTLGLTFDSAVGNTYQFDGVTASLTATMAQYNDPSSF